MRGLHGPRIAGVCGLGDEVEGDGLGGGGGGGEGEESDWA